VIFSSIRTTASEPGLEAGIAQSVKRRATRLEGWDSIVGICPQRCKFLNLHNPSGRIGPGDYSASSRNEYQKHKNNNVFGE
jgi:hypothetical protein